MEKDFWNIIEGIYGSKVDTTNVVSLEKDLGFSSLQLVQLIVELEEHFGIEIPIDEFKLELIDSPKQFIEYIMNIS